MKTKVKEMRIRRGMTQTELATRAGVPQPAICEIETGKTIDPASSTLFKLAKALRCLMDDLIQDDNASHDPSA